MLSGVSGCGKTTLSLQLPNSLYLIANDIKECHLHEMISKSGFIKEDIIIIDNCESKPTSFITKLARIVRKGDKKVLCITSRPSKIGVRMKVTESEFDKIFMTMFDDNGITIQPHIMQSESLYNTFMRLCKTYTGVNLHKGKLFILLVKRIGLTSLNIDFTKSILLFLLPDACERERIVMIEKSISDYKTVCL